MTQAKALCMMTRIGKMLGVRGTTLQEVHDTLLSEGVSEYDIFLNCKGAAMIYPHVQDALDEAIPPTQPSPIHENVCPDCDALNEGRAGRCHDCSQ